MEALKMFTTYLSAALLFLACGGKSKEQSENISEVAIIVADTVENTNENDNIFSYKANIKCERSGRVEAIYETNPMSYQEMNRDNIIRDMNNITGLFCEDGECYLKPTEISFLDGYNECAGVPTLALVSDAKFLFLNFADYNKNKIQPILSETKYMFPGDKFTFELGNKIYEIEAFGNLTEDIVENYSLVYSVKGTSNRQTIVSIEEIRFTTVELLFIGDLDGDGKPDVILDAPSDYENRKIFLFLSSATRENEYLRCEAKKLDDLSC